MRTSTLRSSLSSFPCILRQTLLKINYKQILTVESKRNASLCNHTQLRWKSGRKVDISSLVVPVPGTTIGNNGDSNVGEELTKKFDKYDILKIINQFYDQREVKYIAAKNGLDSKLFHRAAIEFRNFCMETEILPADLHIVLSDILRAAGHLHDILPYFLQHAKQTFPHLECTEELKKRSDLRQPADWYEQAQAIKRKLIFHAGPTNSGKTYQALERIINSKSGVYCSPLKLLAEEVFKKVTNRGIKCDLVTGEKRKHVLPNNAPADHVACTIEMVSVQKKYEVAVIDEIQMLKDPCRGWAWTRALLGLVAEEIHICGEEAAIDLVKEIARSCGEEVEVRKYKRKTMLTVEDSALQDLNNLRRGDCIVCFKKQDIFNVCLELDKKGRKYAVIYGGLPPDTKLAQEEKFNDPDHDCEILVATDAIGMGLNLSIQRVIFYSLKKAMMNEEMEMEMNTISTSQALQIAGRAGRYGKFKEGFVTTFRSEDLSILKDIMSKNVEPLEKAGLYPTAEQVEDFAYQLPEEDMSNLIDIFLSLCVMNTSSYFMCDTTGFKILADKIQHILLPHRARYVFCCAPVDSRRKTVLSMFEKFAKQYEKNEPLTVKQLQREIKWPFSLPKNIGQLEDLQDAYDVLGLYLWFSYRFPDLFPHLKDIQSMQKELDEIIQQGVLYITHLRATKATDGLEDQAEDKGLSKPSKYVPSVSTASFEMAKTQQEPSHGKFATLTQKLLSEGSLTHETLRILQKEWKAMEEQQTDSSLNPFAEINSQGFHKTKKEKKRNKCSM